MDQHSISRAVNLLENARNNGDRIQRFPPELRPSTEHHAYQIQFALHERLAASQGGQIGWKIGCTTPVMQAFLQIETPCAGGMMARSLLPCPTTYPLSDRVRTGVECEIAVRLREDIDTSRTSVDLSTATDAVGDVMVAMEIVEDRYHNYAEFSALELIADDFFHRACILGPPVTDWRNLDLCASAGRTLRDGIECGAGTGADIMGHPFAALVWLSDALAQNGRKLRAGDIVMLGSVVATQWVDEPSHISVDVDDLGKVDVYFVDAPQI